MNQKGAANPFVLPYQLTQAAVRQAEGLLATVVDLAQIKPRKRRAVGLSSASSNQQQQQSHASSSQQQPQHRAITSQQQQQQQQQPTQPAQRPSQTSSDQSNPLGLPAYANTMKQGPGGASDLTRKTALRVLAVLGELLSLSLSL